MGFFDSPKRASNIQVLNIEDSGSNVMISYLAINADGSQGNNRKNVKDLRGYNSYPAGGVHIIKTECLGKVYCGIIKSDVRLLFLAKLSDKTMDILQAKEGSSGCNSLLALTLKNDKDVGSEQDTGSSQESKSERIAEDIDIPIEILPNLYSLSLSNLALKHHRTYKNGKIDFDYVTLKCRVNYQLNGRKEGKRKLIFTSYDEKDGVIQIRGDYDKYHFTEAGHEFVEICFDDYGTTPVKRISVSVKEN